MNLADQWAATEEHLAREAESLGKCWDGCGRGFLRY